MALAVEGLRVTIGYERAESQMEDNTLLVAAGEILALQRRSTRGITKADIAALLECHLQWAGREARYQKVLQDLDACTLARNQAERQARDATRKAFGLEQRIEELEAAFSPAKD